MMRAKSVWGLEISSEAGAATSIGAAVTRRKARSFMRKGRGKSIRYGRSNEPPPLLTRLHALRHTAEKKRVCGRLEGVSHAVEVTGRNAVRSRSPRARCDPRQRIGNGEL